MTAPMQRMMTMNKVKIIYPVFIKQELRKETRWIKLEGPFKLYEVLINKRKIRPDTSISIKHGKYMISYWLNELHLTRKHNRKTFITKECREIDFLAAYQIAIKETNPINYGIL